MTIEPHPLVRPAAPGIDRLLARFRESTCVIQRKGSSQDAGGAPASGGYSTVATVGCQVAAAGRLAVERVFGGQFGPEIDYVVKMPRDTSLTSDDQIVVNGTTMQIVSDDGLKSYGFELLVAAKATE
jgi:hypothetical protein